MKKLFKILTMVAAVLTTAVVFTTCKQFLDDPEEFFSYWAAEVVSGDYIIDKPTQTNTDGVQCIPSTSDVRLTVKLNNPKNFTLVMPTSPANAGKVINFPGLSPQPEYGTDYTLQQAGSTLNLVYKSAFLKEHEWNTGNIGPEITLIADDGREFSKPFTAHVEVNTPPKLSFTGSIGKTANPIGGKHYYVIILKAEDMSETAGIGSSAGKLHKDIKRLTVEGGNSENISFTAGHTAFTVDTSTPVTNRRLLAATEVAQITSVDLGGSTPLPSWAPSHNADPWALRYRTGTEVKGAQALYKFRLYDEKGLSSEEVSASTVKIKAEDVRLYKDPSNPSTEITTLAASSASPYVITVAPGTQNVTVTAKTETADATISGSVKKHNGSGWVDEWPEFIAAPNNLPIELTAPASAGGTIQYKINVQAGGAGFDNSTEKTFYVTVKTNDTTTINSGIGAWDALKYAVEQTGYTTIKINGTITAPNQAGKQINVRRNVTIEGQTGSTTDKLQGRPNTYIFDISGDGNLTLKKLTLLGGKNKNTSIGGGAIYCAGAALTTDDVIIQSCEAKNGGAIYAKEVFVPGNDIPSVITLKNTQIKLCAAEEKGGAIYCKKSTLTLESTIIGGSMNGNAAAAGGGIYLTGRGASGEMKTNCTISHNRANGGTGIFPQGAGIYIGASASFIMNNGSIDHNTSASGAQTANGGGVHIQGNGISAAGTQASFTMENGTISHNTAGAPSSSDPTFPNAGTGYGGGVSTDDGGVFTMEGGTISDNKALRASGGGVAVHGAMTMTGGTIKQNQADIVGFSSSSGGGGIYLWYGVSGKPTLNMSGGTIQGNTIGANSKGQGVMVNHGDGTVKMQMSGNAKIHTNNDVYLENGAKITVNTVFNFGSTPADKAARITPQTYGATVQVLDGYALDTEHGKFTVTPQPGPPLVTWSISNTGTLKTP